MPTTPITNGSGLTVDAIRRVTPDRAILIDAPRIKRIGSAVEMAAPVQVLGFGESYAFRKTEAANAFCVGEHVTWTIPNLDFRGAPLGIDIRLVVKTGLTRILDTATAHKNGGKIPIGEARGPLEAFEPALRGFAKVVEGQPARA